jgi:hypothetical protein
MRASLVYLRGGIFKKRNSCGGTGGGRDRREGILAYGTDFPRRDVKDFREFVIKRFPETVTV